MSTTLATFIGRYGVAILFFAGFLLVGLILDQALGAFLRSASLRNKSRLLSAVVRSFRGITSLAFGLVGFWLAFIRVKTILARDTSTINKVLVAATIAIVTIFLARLAGRFINVYTDSDSSRIPTSSIFTNLIRVVIYIIGVALVLSASGVSITPIITTLGIGGVAIGLALQPTLGNLFAGVQIVTSHRIEPGDFVRLASGDEGTVEDVTWSNTTIRKPTSELVIVPNSVLGAQPVINFSRNNYQHSLVVPLIVAADTNLLHLERVVREIADETVRSSHYTYKAAAPVFRLTALSPAGISFNMILPVISYRSEGTVKSEFLERLSGRFTAEGIELAKPLAPAPAAPPAA